MKREDLHMVVDIITGCIISTQLGTLKVAYVGATCRKKRLGDCDLKLCNHNNSDTLQQYCRQPKVLLLYLKEMDWLG